MKHIRFASVAVTAIAIASPILTGCGSTKVTTSTTARPSATVAPTGTSAKVGANTATKDQLVAAMESAGIANASKWADEIIEYRPYSTSDASLTTLKGELAKYNASTDTIAKIISMLEL